jgi:hypothetical protein
MTLYKKVAMRTPLIIVAAALVACGRGESSELTLEVGKVERVNGCHLFLHHALAQDPPVADVTYVCDVPESALNEKNWWGEKTQPPASSIYVGDCIRLDETFYCMEKIEPGKSASLKATYKQMHRTGDFLKQIR